MAKSSTSTSKTYQCTTCCNKSFSTAYGLGRHNKSGQKAHKCHWKECTKKFVQKSALDDHIRLKHTDDKPRKCPFCPERFATCYKVNDHMASMHQDRLWHCAGSIGPKRQRTCHHTGSRNSAWLDRHIKATHGAEMFDALAIPPAVRAERATPNLDDIFIYASSSPSSSSDGSNDALEFLPSFESSSSCPSTTSWSEQSLGPLTEAWAPWMMPEAFPSSSYDVAQSPFSNSSSLRSTPFPLTPEPALSFDQSVHDAFDVNGWCPELGNAFASDVVLDFGVAALPQFIPAVPSWDTFQPSSAVPEEYSLSDLTMFAAAYQPQEFF